MDDASLHHPKHELERRTPMVYIVVTSGPWAKLPTIF